MSKEREELLNQRFILMQKRMTIAKEIDDITKDDPVFPEVPGVVYRVNRPNDVEMRLFNLSCEHGRLICQLDDNKALLKTVK